MTTDNEPQKTIAELRSAIREVTAGIDRLARSQEMTTDERCKLNEALSCFEQMLRACVTTWEHQALYLGRREYARVKEMLQEYGIEEMVLDGTRIFQVTEDSYTGIGRGVSHG